VDVDLFILLMDKPYVNKVTIVKFGDQEVVVMIFMKDNLLNVEIKIIVINGEEVFVKIIMNLSFILIRSLKRVTRVI